METKIKAGPECTCYSSGFDPDCDQHAASVRGRCHNWKRYQGYDKPRCWRSKGCPMCWEKYHARKTIERLAAFYHLTGELD